MLIDICVAVLLDWLIGDPPNWPHPVRFIGWLISAYEKLVRRFFKNLYLGGWFLLAATILTVLAFYMLAGLIFHPILFRILNIYLLYTAIACRCLKDEALKVKRLIEEERLEESRKELSYLVGRSTEALDKKQVLRGIIETVSENTVDGILAPIFYMIIGSFFGIPAIFALCYKAVNTLDSMIGYIQEPYKEIGFASAKTDDVLNFIPARIGAMLMLLAGAIVGLNFKEGLKVVLRDHANHKSPNCGYPEAATAGLLGIQLGGNNVYFGEIVKKPTIGDFIKELSTSDIDYSVKVMYVSEILMILAGSLLLYLITI